MTKTIKNQAAINVTSVSVSSVQTVLDSISALGDKRKALVQITGKTGEIQKAYATQMNLTFGAGWYDAKGEIKKAVKSEHDEFVIDFEAIGKTRAWIDQVWSRVKDDAGRVKSVSVKATGGAGVDAKTISELKTVYNRLADSNEDDSPLSYKIKSQLEDILDMLGVEI